MLRKPIGSDDFHQIIDFLNSSHIKFALTVNPKIFVDQVQEFWNNATIETVNEARQIRSTVCGK